MTREQALDLVHRLVEAVNAHDIPRLITFYAADAITLSPVSGQITGLVGISDWWQTIFSLFPDWTVKLSDVLVDGDRVAFFGTAAATDKNGWFGQPPTGERFEYRAIIVLDVFEGKIVRDERVYDLSGVLQRLEKSRLDQELRLAADVQRALLSSTHHLTAYGEVIGDSLPCRAIGGDFFESIQLVSGDLGIALGDVAGKGPSSALLAAMIQGMLAVQLQTETSPPAILSQLNQLLAARHLEPRFATLALGVLSPSGRFTCSNAGHNSPIVLTRDGIVRPASGGPVLGVFGDSTFQEETLFLSDGDTLIMFSDGVIEARDTRDREFGEERLISCATACSSRPIVDVLRNIFAAVHTFCKHAPQADDITVLVARFRSSQQ